MCESCPHFNNSSSACLAAIGANRCPRQAEGEKKDQAKKA